MAGARTLMIDADDTLWENNIYFVRAIEGFVRELSSRGLDPRRVEEHLWQVEQRNIKVTGYGSKAFCDSMHEASRALGVLDMEPWIARREEEIFHHPIELMPGVAETLARLRSRNRLILVSKGDREEQLAKLRRSGLAGSFHHAEILFEKSAESYRQLIAQYGLAGAEAWMIGNSPRSDINPAKAAGLRTVFIPYHTTWHHEIEEISPEGETLVLKTFAELAEHFA